MSRLSPPSKIDLPAVDDQLKYSIGFDWGGLHVTEEAHTQYGLVPLVPTEDGGSFEQPDKSGDPRTDIFLVGQRSATFSAALGGIGVEGSIQTRIATHKKGFAFEIELPTQKQFASTMNESADLVALMAGIDKEDLVDEDGVNFEDAMTNDATQTLAHILSGIAAQTAGQGALVSLAEARDGMEYRNVTRPLKTTAAFALGMTVSDIAIRTSGEQSYLGASAVASMLVGAYASAKNFRQAISDRAENEALMHDSAAHLANQVGLDIHNAFSRSNFDNNFAR